MNIPPHEVHAWIVGPLTQGRPTDNDWQVLSKEETARAHRLRFELDRARFVSAHATLRYILSRYTKLAPAHHAFVTGEHGKPSLEANGDGPSIHFNLSQSYEFAAVAVSVDREVGVDIQQHMVGRLSVEDIARSYFSAGESDRLMQLEEPDRSAAFYRCWARKEAVLKAIGTGLMSPLNSFEVSIGPADPRVIHASRDAERVAGLTLADLSAPPDYAAAVAAEGKDWNLVEQRVNGSV